MTYGPGKLRPSKRGRQTVWVADWTDATGRRHRQSYGVDRDLAQRRLNRVIRERDLQVAGLSLEDGLSRPVEVLEVYWESEARSRMSGSTYQKVRCTVERILQGLGVRTLGEITPEAVSRYRSARLLEGVGRATINRQVGHLQTALRCLVDLRVIPRSPLEGLKTLSVTTRDAVRPARALSDVECLRLLEAVQALDRERGVRYPQYLVVLGLLSTGARWGELREVVWEDIREGQLHLRRTKNGTPRTIPLPGELLRALMSVERHPRVFAGTHGQAQSPSTRNFNRHWLTPALERAEIAKTTAAGTVHVHALRHTYATRLARAGVPLRLAMYLTGHKTLSVLTSIYQHVGAADVREAVQSLPTLGTRLVRPEEWQESGSRPCQVASNRLEEEA